MEGGEVLEGGRGWGEEEGERDGGEKEEKEDDAGEHK